MPIAASLVTIFVMEEGRVVLCVNGGRERSERGEMIEIEWGGASDLRLLTKDGDWEYSSN